MVKFYRYFLAVLLIWCCVKGGVSVNTAPMFSGTPYNVEVVKDAYEKVIRTIFRVTVTDSDSGNDGQITVSIPDNAAPFEVYLSNQIRLTGSIKDITGSEYKLVVTATDAGTPPLTSTATVTISLAERLGDHSINNKFTGSVQAKSEHSPVFTSPSRDGSVRVKEGQTTPGQQLLVLAATDPDNSGTLTYSIKSVTPDIPDTLVLVGDKLNTGSTPLDHEKAADFKIIFSVTDGKYSADSETFTVFVDNVNDNYPIFKNPDYNITIKERFFLNHVVLPVVATDVESEAYQLELYYTIIDGNEEGVFSIQHNVGDILLVKHPTVAVYNLVVSGSDLGNPPLNTTVDVVINVKNNQDECLVYPCGINGTCTSGINSYSCICPPGSTGSHCETNIDDCKPDSCLNGGTCTDAHLGFTCECPVGWTGTTCSEPCTGHTYGKNCESKCICDDSRLNITVKDTQKCDVISGVCHCNEKFTGEACDLDVNECFQNPNLCNSSANTECQNEIGGYVCVCKYGYIIKNTSTTCEKESEVEMKARLCAKLTCSNDQICIFKDDQAYCGKPDSDDESLILGITLGLLGLILLAVVVVALCLWCRYMGVPIRRKYDDDEKSEVSEYESRRQPTYTAWLYSDRGAWGHQPSVNDVF